MKLFLAYLVVAIVSGFGTGEVFSANAPGAEQARKLQAVLDAPPPDPDATSKANLEKIYLERGRAAGALGDVDRQLKELNQGIRAIGPKDSSSYEPCGKAPFLSRGRTN